MAILERGKGKRKQTVELVQFDHVLRMQEIEAGDVRLPGYRRFPTADAARAGLISEVRSLIESGMQPGDDEARAIAASLPSKTDDPPALPIRRDLAIYNEATGFVVTSRRMAGKTLDEGSAAWKKAVAKGDLIPLSLIQDDPFIIRIVAGDRLTPQENAQWVARVDAHLKVPDGRLCVTGGAAFTNEDYDADDPHHEQYVGEVAVPKGHYRAALYSLSFGLGDHAERGDRDDQHELVDFLLHLEPVDATPESGLSELPKDGWFAGEENVRAVNTTSGTAAKDVIRPRQEGEGSWTYVWRVFESLPAIDRTPVKGEAVTLPLASLAHAARIAWFGSRFTMIELRLTAPAGGSLDLSGEWPEGVVAVDEIVAGRIFYDNDLGINDTLPRLAQLAPRLSKLADGTILDLCSIATQTMPGSADGAGLIYLRGTIRDGAWRIMQAFPSVDAATLAAALKFCAAAERDPVQAIGPFADRFSSTWPLVQLPPTAEGPADADENVESDGMFPTKPIKGAAVFTAPGGREYHATMAMLVHEKAGDEVQKRERALFAVGFKHVGDLVCSDNDQVAYRGYTKAGHAWAYFRVSAPANVSLAIATRFAAGNDSYVTVQKGGVNIKDLLVQHEETVEVLAEQFGEPAPTAPTSVSFAQTIEAVLLSE
jgi:hypothetical protein